MHVPREVLNCKFLKFNNYKQMLSFIFKRNELTTLLPNKYCLFNTETNKISNNVRSTKNVC